MQMSVVLYDTIAPAVLGFMDISFRLSVQVDMCAKFE